MPAQRDPLPPALLLMGPTAAGKTELAVALTQVLPCEIISVDSAMVYQGMTIGTAKPDAAVLATAPHHLIDFLDPAVSYSAADFRTDALAVMAEITARGRIPLLVGGTMLYFKVLQDGVASLPAADPSVRQQLLTTAQQRGWAYLHARLATIDPLAAERIKPTDSQRLQRALEVYALTGRPLSAWHQEQSTSPFPYRPIPLATAPATRTVLHARIGQRFQQMLAAGLEAEVWALYQRGDLHGALPAIKAVGYRQLWAYFSGELTYPQMVERSVIATRQLAKRQLTWLRRWPDVHWFDTLAADRLTAVLQVLSTCL